MSLPGTEFLQFESSDAVGKLTLDRPPANVMHIPLLRELAAVLDQAAGDASLKVLVLGASGKLFSAGVDVGDHTVERVGEMIPLFHQVCLAIAEFPCPTLAAVQGHALGGGCELVLCTDFALMAEGARIGQPEIQLAAMAPIAALRLPGLVGPRWAARLVFTGEQLEAEKAAEIGLVDSALPLDELTGAVDDLIGRLSALSTAALRLNKRALLLGLQGWASSLDEMESLYLDELMATEDALEGLKAFLEKRSPVWQNR